MIKLILLALTFIPLVSNALVFKKPNPKFNKFKSKFEKVIGDQNLCETNIYKVNNSQTSELMHKIIQESSIVPLDNWTVNPKFKFNKGWIKSTPLRGGKDIFDKMATLIRAAKHEVLFETMIFQINSNGAKIIYKGIVDLYNKRKKLYQKLGDKYKPISIKFVFDITGSNRKLNLFEAMTFSRGGGREFGKEGYNIDFPIQLDPKILKLEIRGHRHKDVLAVSHSKGIIVDRKISIITGANVVGYHFSDEIGHKLDQELMVDHGFLLYGKIAQAMADDFYNLWNKDAGKKNGWTEHYGSNIDVTKNKEIYDPNLIPDWPNYEKELNSFPSMEFVKSDGWIKLSKTMMASRKNNSTWKRSMGFNPFNEKKRARVLKRTSLNPQNQAFASIFKHAKSHININTPSLNSSILLAGIVSALTRGVDINILISKNYQNYNGPFQEEGTNQDAITKLKKYREILKKLNNKKIGNLNIKWFVTRGGLLSGKQKGKETQGWRILLNEKFWNHNHTKFLSADNQVIVIGSANMDEQSYYNSRELNLVIDSHRASKKLCKKVFKTDFLRATASGIKKLSGEKCYRNNECEKSRGLFCDNKAFGGSWQCVYRQGKSLNGGFCNKNIECKSRMCDKSNHKCI